MVALGAVGIVLGASALIGRRNAPDPSHLGIRSWYRRLDKPGFTPPDAAFGAVWPILDTGLAAGCGVLRDQPVFILLCTRAGDSRDAGADGDHRRLVPRSSVVWQPADGPASSAAWPCRWSLAGTAVDGKDEAVAIYQRPRTSDPHPEHRIYPYLLHDLEITRPGHAWCTDIAYLPMRRGFLYLVAIMDQASRAVLAWRLSNTMDTEFASMP